MNQSKRSRTRAPRLLDAAITGAWIVLGLVLSMMCIKVFGDNIADVGAPALAVTGALIWYFTERRDRNKLKEAREEDLKPAPPTHGVLLLRSQEAREEDR